MVTATIKFPNKSDEKMFVAVPSQEELLTILRQRGTLPGSMSKYSPIQYDISFSERKMIIDDAMTGKNVLVVDF